MAANNVSGGSAPMAWRAAASCSRSQFDSACSARAGGRQGARMLRESGVRSAVFPVDFPYTALFIRQGRRFLAKGPASPRTLSST